MISSRIAAVACTLCLAAPAAAGASPTGGETTAPKGPYGTTVASGVPHLAKAKGPYGTTVVSGPADRGKPKGPYGVAPSASGLPRLAKAKGPYGTIVVPTDSRVAAANVGATGRDETDDWRTAAIFEAALLAVLALGSARLLGGRRHIARFGA